eukprot:15343756-Heterocapsa_arctica.AAC.1
MLDRHVFWTVDGPSAVCVELDHQILYDAWLATQPTVFGQGGWHTHEASCPNLFPPPTSCNTQYPDIA